MYDLFRQSIEPLKNAGKLAMILVQFPPWFDCNRKNVEMIRLICKRLEGFDIAVEFRHQSWYSERFVKGTLDFLRGMNAIHTVCDEPQAGIGSMPLVPESTRQDKALFRLHGRNVYGWRNITGNRESWRKVRYLYDYNDS